MSKKEHQQGGDVAVRDEKAGAVAALSVNAASFFEDAGKGTEGADKDSFAIPFLSILQPLSPQVVDGKVGAKAGLFINSVTGEMTEEVLLIPVAFQRRYLRWAPREKGGGYKGDFSPADVDAGNVEGMVRGDDNQLYIGGTNPKEHDKLKDTRNHFVLVVRPDGTWSQALISMTSTQIKKSKRWISQIQGIQLQGPQGVFNPPSFSHVYKATSLKEQNDQGTWYGWHIELISPVQSAEIYAAAKAFHASVAAGKVEVAPPVNDEPAGEGNERF